MMNKDMCDDSGQSDAEDDDDGKTREDDAHERGLGVGEDDEMQV